MQQLASHPLTQLSSSSSLTEERQVLMREARALADSFDASYWLAHDSGHEYPMEFLRAFADRDWLTIMLPEDLGGQGLGLTDASLMLYEVAASGAALSGTSCLHFSIFPPGPILRHGTDEQRREYLPPISRGETLMAFAVTEPTAGTDTSRITTRARKENGGWRVNGQKVWTSNAQNASRMLLLARTDARDDDHPFRGMTLFYAHLDREHVALHPIDKLGRLGMDSNAVFIEDLYIDDADVIGEVGQGFTYLLDGLNPERIVVAFEAIGSARAALALASGYAADRFVFGRAIGANQSVAHPLGRAWAHLEGAELVALRAAELFDAGLPCGREANTAKYLAAEAAYEAADAAVQAHGGYGYAKEYHVERMWRDIRLFRLAPISQELVLNYICSKVLGLPTGNRGQR